MSAFFAAGNVHLLPFAGADEYIAELVTFPAASNDDQVDATTQALDYLLGATQANPAASAAQTMQAMLGRRR